MAAEIFRFGDFELDRSAYELRRAGTAVHLQRIPFQLLSLLVERRGQLVTREEILERIWGKGVFVDSENSINSAVRKIRRALNDHSDAPRFIITVPARGYRFAASPMSLHPPTPSVGIYDMPSPFPFRDKPSIAVLPFTDMSSDHDQEYFSDGITDDLITALSRLPGVFVIARSSTFTYKGKAAKVQDIGRDLGWRTCWRAACGSPTTNCGSPLSWSRPLAATICGPNATTAHSKIFLHYKTRSC